MSWMAAVVLALLPFHAFLTVWLSSFLDHYTLLRLWKEVSLIMIAVGAAYILVGDKRLRKQLLGSRLAQLILVYLALSIVYGLVGYWLNKVSIKALGFGLIINLRFLIFFLSLWIIATKSQILKRIWPKLVLIPASIVILIGLFQRIVLPYDFLRHFGYSEQTIFPYQTINHNINFPRIMSTLRGANPLGAYLILVLSTVAVLFSKFKQKRRIIAALGFAGILTLFFSYSRGAWIGAALSGLFLLGLSYKRISLKKILIPVVGVLLILGIATVLVVRNNPTFENYFFHTNDRSTVEESSNEAHVSALRNGIKDVIHEPLGRGVGTAGPASVYNRESRVSENYFVQIAQEIGWIGLILFLTINVFIFRELWLRRRDTMARVLLVSFIGLTAVNLVSHAWTDDTLAYIWWGLAGIALATSVASKRKR